MDRRLNFALPEFTRIVWASPAARQVWEPRIARIANMWTYLERIAVLNKIKPACLQTCPPGDLPTLVEWALSFDLMCIPLARQGASCGYSNSTQPITGAWEYRVVITNPDLARLFIEFWREQDNERIGASLGFPNCCREFFEKNWVRDDWRDLTLPMVLGDGNESTYSVGGPLECNILLRWLGVRLVSHLPCSFGCEATEKIGREMATLGLGYGYVEEVDWLTQMLNWPVRWSSLHGVATITTPVLRIITDSTALKTVHVIDRPGPVYPIEGVRGTEFPFVNDVPLTVRGTNTYSDNGFSSAVAMDCSHSVILRAVEGISGKVLDLGCGNGVLLKKLATRYGLLPCGVESDEQKFQRAARRLLSMDADVHHADIFAQHFWNPPYGVALLSLNRLHEVDEVHARELLLKLRDNCHRVVFYSYEHAEWPGIKIEGASSLFSLDAHFADGNTCAILCTPRRDCEHDSL